MATSTRELRVDLRQPAGFDRVYQLPGQQRAGQSTKAGDFVRFDSGVAAVFPRSQYVMTSRGLMPQVPAGTKFYIGKLPDSVVQAGVGSKAAPSLLRIDRGVDMSAREARPQATPGETRVSTRVDMRANADTGAQPQVTSEPASILSDAKARERWIDGLGSGKK